MTNAANGNDCFSEAFSWPKISIVTPSFNQGEYLEETILSVLDQEYPNLEYIILDAGSTDNSVDIIEKYRSRFSMVRIGRDDGQSAALCEGFSAANGEILAWLNSDDRYAPGAFKRVAEYFSKNQDVLFISGDVNFIDANGDIVKRICATRPSHMITANLGVHRWPQQGCFWRKSAYEQVGGIDRELQFTMDRDLFIRFAALGKSKRIGGRPLADFRIHDGAKSSTILDVGARESVLLIERYGTCKGWCSKMFLKLYWILLRVPPYVRGMCSARDGERHVRYKAQKCNSA